MKHIYLAGGCFWGLEAYMAKVVGVIEVFSGYANGNTENPSYEEVCRGNTGHAETVSVGYNPEKIDLETLLTYYFKVIDPTTIDRQGADIGSQYRTGIFFTNQSEEILIQDFINRKQKAYKLPIRVVVEPLKSFYKAEEYHQKYLEKNPRGYCHINLSLALEPIIEADLYHLPEKAILKNHLTALQMSVTQESATERPFDNPYWNLFEEGIYVDVTTGEPLFSSLDKFSSECGWPSFSKPISKEVVFEVVDDTHGMERIEVRSRVGNAHLGHVFNDGPKMTGGLRYCINSAALDFIPLNDMSGKGYGFLKSFLFPEL